MLYKIRGFKRTFANERIVSVGNLDIPRGGIIAVIGTSGSGKSTLVGALGGLIPRANDVEGQIDYYPIGGSAVVSVLDDPYILFKEKIGFIFQSSDLLKDQTTTANLALSVMHIKKQPLLSRLYQLVSDLSLDPVVMSAKSSTLSGGEAQRVAMLRVLLRDPETIIADEPTASLDPKTAESVMSGLKKWSGQENKTVIWVTHDLNAVAEYADKILVLNLGQSVHNTIQENPKSAEALLSMISNKDGEDDKDVKKEECNTKEIDRPLSGARKKYVSNYLLNSQAFRKFTLSPLLLKATGYPSRENLDAALTITGGGGKLSAFRRFGASLKQIIFGFGQKGTVATEILVLSLFLFLLCAFINVEIENSRTLSGPTLSNVVVNSSDDFDLDSIEILEGELINRLGNAAAMSGLSQNFKSEAVVTDMENGFDLTAESIEDDVSAKQRDVSKRIVFGRYGSPSEVSQARVSTNNNQPSCSSGRAKDANLLAVEVSEPGIKFLDYYQGQSIANLIAQSKPTAGTDNLPFFGLFHNDNKIPSGPDFAELLHPSGNTPFGAIVTKKFLRDSLGLGDQDIIPEYFCLSYFTLEPEPMRIVGIVDALSISTSRDFDILISEEYYRGRYLDRSIPPPEYSKIAVYVDVEQSEVFFNFFKSLSNPDYADDLVQMRLYLERGYKKLEKAIKVAEFYRGTITFLGAVMAALIIYIMSYQIYGMISRNGRSFLVAKAFGFTYRDLILCFSGAYFVTFIISATVFYLPVVFGIWLFPSTWDWKYVSYVGGMLKVDAGFGVYAIVCSLILTVLVIILALLFSTAAWWHRNRSIHDGIRSS